MIRNRIKNVCVYCGSSSGNRDEYQHIATELAAELVSRKLGLVYGGSSTGIMGKAFPSYNIRPCAPS